MSGSIPPRWHETEEGEVSIPVRDASARVKAPSMQSIVPARRTPAAVIGILIVAVLGISFVQGWSFLTGQSVTDNQPRVLLTGSGAIPETITVAAGQQITFRNESPVPQLLTFETLMGEDGEPIQTSAIFQLSDARITIPASIPPGEYPYYSSTLPAVSGTIIVVAPGSALQPQDVVAASSAPAAPIVLPSSAAPISSVPALPVQAASSASSIAPVAPQGAIPNNPYVIGSDTNRITVIPQGTSDVPSITEHTPLSNTETGSAAWATVLIFTLSLLFVLRRAKAL